MLPPERKTDGNPFHCIHLFRYTYFYDRRLNCLLYTTFRAVGGLNPSNPTIFSAVTTIYCRCLSKNYNIQLLSRQILHIQITSSIEFPVFRNMLSYNTLCR